MAKQSNLIQTSSTPSMSASDRADAFVDQLSGLSVNEDPITVLRRMFSVGSSESTTSSSFVGRQQKAVHNISLLPFSEIGLGSVGIVFDIPGENRVIKKAISVDRLANVWNDCTSGTSVYEAFNAARAVFESQISLPWTPSYFAFHRNHPDQLSEWWKANSSRFPGGHGAEPECIFLAERVLPLPKPIRDALIELYCPPGIKPSAKASAANRDCLARLYLGRRRKSDKPSMFFTLRNFLLHLDQALEIFPDEIFRFAKEMAAGLAAMHWACKIDANDVEFVVGSAPTYKQECLTPAMFTSVPDFSDLSAERKKDLLKRTVHLWIIDFDRVRPITLDEEGVEQAVRAAEENDPYFPKPVPEGEPDSELWRVFRQAYVDVSSRILRWKGHKGCGHLPGRFVDRWEAIRRAKARTQVRD